jgi:septation ring formation regulator EzrA
MVMNNPFDRHKDPLNHDIFERFFTHMDIVKKRKEFVQGVYEDVMKQIENRLKEMTPDLLTNFNMLYQELTQNMNEFQKTINVIEKKSKKVFESSTLCEDVYKMRDEMKAMKKKLDKFNSGIKKAFVLD